MNKKYRRHNIKLPAIHAYEYTVCMSYDWKFFFVFHSTILIGYMYSTQSSTATFFPPLKFEFFMHNKEPDNPQHGILILQ